MKITLKTLKGEQFQVELEPNQTILNLKEKVFQMKGLEIDSLKLVHKGKQHPDEKTIQECNIQEGEFIVITTSQKKPAQQPQQQQQVSQPPVNQSSSQQVQNQGQQQQPLQANRPQSQNQGNNMVIGEEHRQNVEMIVAMGFEKEKVEQALRAAYMNPDRAIEYLINNNIPAFDQQDPQGNLGSDQDEDFGDGQDLPEQLEQLANQPPFVRLRQLISQNPAMLQTIMQNIQEENPEIYQLISTYPQILLGNQQQGGGTQYQPRPSNQIVISQEDKEAIDRIHSLGFGKSDSLEAYLACGRDENMAVNLLLERQEKGELYTQEEEQLLLQQSLQQSAQQTGQQQQQPNQNNQSNNNNPNNNNNQNNNGGNNGGSDSSSGNNGGNDNIFD